MELYRPACKGQKSPYTTLRGLLCRNDWRPLKTLPPDSIPEWLRILWSLLLEANERSTKSKKEGTLSVQLPAWSTPRECPKLFPSKTWPRSLIEKNPDNHFHSGIPGLLFPLYPRSPCPRAEDCSSMCTCCRSLKVEKVLPACASGCAHTVHWWLWLLLCPFQNQAPKGKKATFPFLFSMFFWDCTLTRECLLPVNLVKTSKYKSVSFVLFPMQWKKDLLLMAKTSQC